MLRRPAGFFSVDWHDLFMKSGAKMLEEKQTEVKRLKPEQRGRDGQTQDQCEGYRYLFKSLQNYLRQLQST